VVVGVNGTSGYPTSYPRPQRHIKLNVNLRTTLHFDRLTLGEPTGPAHDGFKQWICLLNGCCFPWILTMFKKKGKLRYFIFAGLVCVRGNVFFSPRQGRCVVRPTYSRCFLSVSGLSDCHPVWHEKTCRPTTSTS